MTTSRIIIGAAIALMIFGLGALCGFEGGQNEMKAQLAIERASSDELAAALSNLTAAAREQTGLVNQARDALVRDTKLLAYCREDLQRMARSNCHLGEVVPSR